MREGELKMKTKSTLLGSSLGSMMWEIVPFDYSGKPAFIPSKRSFCADRRVWRPARFTSITFTQPISELIWWAMQHLISILIQMPNWLLTFLLLSLCFFLTKNMPCCQTHLLHYRFFGSLSLMSINMQYYLPNLQQGLM